MDGVIKRNPKESRPRSLVPHEAHDVAGLDGGAAGERVYRLCLVQQLQVERANGGLLG